MNLDFLFHIWIEAKKAGGLSCGSGSKESKCNTEDLVRPLGLENPLEKRMAIHSSILAWRIPWTEEPSRLQFMGSERDGHD